MRKWVINKEDGLLYIIAIVVSVFNIVFYQNSVLSYMMALLESGYLFYLVLKKKYMKYLCYYLIFISTSLEFSVFVNNNVIYSLKEIRFLGINMGIWLFMPIAFTYFTELRCINGNSHRYKTFRNDTKFFLGMNVISMVVGIVCILVNDNNIRNMTGYLSTYIDNAYSFMFLPLMIIITFRLALKYNEPEINKIYSSLQAVLWGCAFQALVSEIFNIRGSYGSSTTLNTSMVFVFLPFLLLLSFYENTKYKTMNFFLAITGSFLLLKHGASGKMFITHVLVLLILILKMNIEKSTRKRAKGILLILVLLLSVPLLLAYITSQNNRLLNAKLNQAKQILSIYKWNWDFIRNMEDSPRTRIGELLNVIIEYLKKPWFFLTGKGYGSSVLDHTGILALTPVNWRDTAFPSAQYDNGTFVNLHEITSVMLAFGLPGLIFACKLAKYTLKAFRVNGWILIGAFWFLVYYGYSYTIGTFGMIAMCAGLLQYSQMIDEKMSER